MTVDIQLSAAIVGGDAAGVEAALADGGDPDVLVGRHVLPEIERAAVDAAARKLFGWPKGPWLYEWLFVRNDD